MKSRNSKSEIPHSTFHIPHSDLAPWLSWWPLLFLGTFLLVVLFTFRDYGVTWDEPAQATYGELVLNYFLSGFKDKACNSYSNLMWYGPLFEAMSAAVYKLAPAHKYEIRHLVIGLTTLFGLFGFLKLTRLFKDPWTPLLAPLALIMLPRFYGEAFDNSKDMPFACAFIWFIYSTVKMFSDGDFSWKNVTLASLAAGLTLAIRPSGLAIAAVYALAFAAFSLYNKGLQDRPSSLLLKSAAAVSIAWILMVAFWPWAHENPIFRPIQVTSFISSFPLKTEVLFEGSFHYSTRLPRYYLAKYFLITTPPTLLFFAAIGLWVSLNKWLSDSKNKDMFLHFAAQFWLFLPIFYFFIKRPNVYNGIRHFVFIMPALGFFAGFGASYLLQKIKQTNSRQTVAAILLAAFLLPIKELVSLHPYQRTYFNILAGGVRKAYLSYDADYWISSYKEACEWIKKEHEWQPARKLKVLAASNDETKSIAQYYLEPEIEVSFINANNLGGKLSKNYDYYIGMNAHGFALNFPESPVARRVGREGAIFTVIRGQKPLASLGER